MWADWSQGRKLIALGVHASQPSPSLPRLPDRVRAAFLDVDGVLLDSLQPHLGICSDLAAEYALPGVNVPDAASFRAMVATGLKVSPMHDFFLAVGFPETAARRAVADYEARFMRQYQPQPFAGHASMLRRLSDAGLTLGLVTANTRGNVEPALGEAMRYFDRRCLYYHDTFEPPRSKKDCLADGARMLRLAPDQCVFVGDQPADAAAAQAAGWNFLGVSYGWGLLRDEARWPMVHAVGDIADALAPGPRHASAAG